MLKPLLAFALSATAPAALNAQSSIPGKWILAGNTEACMIHSASARGTTVSITAVPGQESFLVVIQNQALGSLSDGEKYPIALEFDHQGEWKIEAMAQNELDRDGPGVVFAVSPGRDDGKSFIQEFSTASGMRIGREGAVLDRLAVTDGRAAMTGLATCLGQLWAGGSEYQGQGGPLEDEETGEQPVPL